MSKIAIEGNVSGTGTLTIAAPNTNTNRTLTLPDATGTLALAGGASDKIEEGDSKVEVVDTGTGHILFQVDNSEVARFNPNQLVTKAGSAATPAVSPTGDLNTGIFFPAADRIGGAVGGIARFNLQANEGQFFVSQDGVSIRTEEGAGTVRTLIFGARNSTGLNLGTGVIEIYTNGDVRNTNGTYTTISDQRLKENIVDANSQWNDIKNLRVRNFNFRQDTGNETHKQLGLIAQEAQFVCPGLVKETATKEGEIITDADGNQLGSIKSVNISVLYMKAVKALQEAIERIETLEAKVAALENNNA